jgi:hypothetical protein
MQIDKILSEVKELEEKDKLLLFNKIEEIFDNLNDQQENDIPIESVFGLWKGRNITKETLREKAWM